MAWALRSARSIAGYCAVLDSQVEPGAGAASTNGLYCARIRDSQTDYEFHYPDGNASIARMLVSGFDSGSIGGKTAEDIVTARRTTANWINPVRCAIRLNSTWYMLAMLEMCRTREAEVSYSREGNFIPCGAKCGDGLLEYVIPMYVRSCRKPRRMRCSTDKSAVVYTSVRSRLEAFENWGSITCLVRACITLTSRWICVTLVTTRLPRRRKSPSWCG